VADAVVGDGLADWTNQDAEGAGPCGRWRRAARTRGRTRGEPGVADLEDEAKLSIMTVSSDFWRRRKMRNRTEKRGERSAVSPGN
jgi:hypothetical protein